MHSTAHPVRYLLYKRAMNAPMAIVFARSLHSAPEKPFQLAERDGNFNHLKRRDLAPTGRSIRKLLTPPEA